VLTAIAMPIRRSVVCQSKPKTSFSS